MWTQQWNGQWQACTSIDPDELKEYFTNLNPSVTPTIPALPGLHIVAHLDLQDKGGGEEGGTGRKVQAVGWRK